MSEKKELNQEQLEKVSGGYVGKYTLMQCSNTKCFHTVKWAGVFKNEVFDCPKCKEHTLKGIEVGFEDGKN